MHESYLFKRNIKRSQKKIKKIQKTEGKKACKRGKTGHIERIRNKNKILRKNFSTMEAGRQRSNVFRMMKGNSFHLEFYVWAT